MATLRSSLPSRLRKLLSGEAAIGPALRLGYSEPIPKITTKDFSTRCPMSHFSFPTRRSWIFTALAMGYEQHFTTTSCSYSGSTQGSSYKYPCVDRVAFTNEFRERRIKVEHDVVTVDRYVVSVIALLRVKTVDVLLASYIPPNADHITATFDLVKEALENRLSVRTVENIISDRRTLRHEILIEITPVLESWGIKCQNCTIQFISYKRHTEQKSTWEKIVDFCVTFIKPMLDLLLWILNMLSSIMGGFGIGDRSDSGSSGGGKK